VSIIFDFGCLLAGIRFAVPASTVYGNKEAGICHGVNTVTDSHCAAPSSFGRSLHLPRSCNHLSSLNANPMMFDSMVFDDSSPVCNTSKIDVATNIILPLAQLFRAYMSSVLLVLE
jgi:hypothetical protein